MEFKTIIEPFRIKMVEPIKMTTASQRQQIMENADYNLFNIKAEDVLIDFLTDSGTSAMSQAQWGQMLEGDESYAGARSFYDFEKEVKELTSFQYIYPTHQGRAAERILFSLIGGEGKIIPNNTHFDTTRANVEFTKTEALDLPCEQGGDQVDQHFLGNMDIQALEKLIAEVGVERIPLCMLTVTNNSGGGRPVSMENIRQVSEICKKYKIPFYLDACRFAENAYFIKHYEQGYQNKTIKEICQQMFSYADGCTMSAKKDAFGNIGGFLALNDSALAGEVKNIGILTEGYPTYGGLAGRDLAALAQGLREIVEEDYLHYRITSTNYLARALDRMGVPVLLPAGGHAVYVDAKKMLPHIPVHQFPAQALACELYIAGGIRTAEIGSLMFGKQDENGNEIAARQELVRLAIPRRTYTQSHVDYVIEVFEYLKSQTDSIQGVKIIESPPFLRHFSAKLARV